MEKIKGKFLMIADACVSFGQTRAGAVTIGVVCYAFAVALNSRRKQLFRKRRVIAHDSSDGSKQAIMLGSSGLVGGLVLQEMLESKQWDRVHIVVRKPSKVKHEKINEILIPDLTKMGESPELQALTRGSIDAAFVTLGVNDPFGWTVRKLYDIEVGLTSIFAKICHTKLDIKYISCLSIPDAERGYEFSPEAFAEKISSWNVFAFFTWIGRIKGCLEDALIKSNIPHVACFQPSNFETDTYRLGLIDMVGQYSMSALNPLMPWKYHSIHVKDLAAAMFMHADFKTEEIRSGKLPTKGNDVLLYTDMMSLVYGGY